MLRTCCVGFLLEPVIVSWPSNTTCVPCAPSPPRFFVLVLFCFRAKNRTAQEFAKPTIPACPDCFLLCEDNCHLFTETSCRATATLFWKTICLVTQKTMTINVTTTWVFILRDVFFVHLTPEEQWSPPSKLYPLFFPYIFSIVFRVCAYVHVWARYNIVPVFVRAQRCCTKKRLEHDGCKTGV